MPTTASMATSARSKRRLPRPLASALSMRLVQVFELAVELRARGAIDLRSGLLFLGGSRGAPRELEADEEHDGEAEHTGRVRQAPGDHVEALVREQREDLVAVDLSVDLDD